MRVDIHFPRNDPATLGDIVHDAAAGANLALAMLPKAMAYAVVAGVPPAYGLYASCAAPTLAVVFGSNRLLFTGPVGVMTVLVLGSLHHYAEPFSPAYIELAASLTLMVGVLNLVFVAARLGFLVQAIPTPVTEGFIAAAALLIIGTQVGPALGAAPLPADSRRARRPRPRLCGHVRLEPQRARRGDGGGSADRAAAGLRPIPDSIVFRPAMGLRSPAGSGRHDGNVFHLPLRRPSDRAAIRSRRRGLGPRTGQRGGGVRGRLPSLREPFRHERQPRGRRAWAAPDLLLHRSGATGGVVPGAAVRLPAPVRTGRGRHHGGRQPSRPQAAAGSVPRGQARRTGRAHHVRNDAAGRAGAGDPGGGRRGLALLSLEDAARTSRAVTSATSMSTVKPCATMTGYLSCAPVTSTRSTPSTPRR